MRRRVVMFVKNSFQYDARVKKEATTLIEGGYRVAVIALHVPGVTTAREETPEGIDVWRVTAPDLGLSTVNALLRKLSRPPVQVVSTATPGAAEAETDAAASARSTVQRGTSVLRRIAGPVPRLVRSAFTNRRMLSVAKQLQPQICHAHDMNTLWLAGTCARATSAQLVYDSHELHTGRNNMGPLRRYTNSLWEGRGVKSADAVIAASRSYARAIAERYGIDDPAVVQNAPRYVEYVDPLDLRCELGIARDMRIILYQGTIQEGRGLEQAIDALDELDRCVLVIIGHGHHRAALRQMVAARGLQSKVRFFGPVPNEDLIRWTASADVGLCTIQKTSPSYYYSLPNKLLEYAMAGIPTVASDFPEMARVVCETGMGEVCDPGDIKATARAIRTVIDDSARNETYRRAARDAAKRYNWEVEGAVLLDIYEALQGG